MIQCPSGRLTLGDADEEKVIDVPVGPLTVHITRHPVEFADHVSIWIDPA